MAENHPNLMKTVHTHPQSYTNFKKDKFKPTPAVSCKMKTKKKNLEISKIKTACVQWKEPQ